MTTVRYQYEKDIEKYLTDRVEERGGMCIKIGMDGMPDRLIVLPGKNEDDVPVYVWCELKRYDGKLSELQRWQLLRLAKVGAHLETPRSKADVDRLLRKYGANG